MPGEPKILGCLPITLAVEAFCLAHLIICISLVTQAQQAPIDISGVLISPIAQWVFGAFLCISIISIISGGVGMLYRIEHLLKGYMGILLMSCGAYLAWLVIFVVFGRSCTTHHKMDGTSTFTCGILDGGILTLITILVLFMVFGIWLISKAITYVRHKYSQELLPDLAKHLSSSIAGPKSDVSNPIVFKVTANEEVPATLMPAYGSVTTPISRAEAVTATPFLPAPMQATGSLPVLPVTTPIAAVTTSLSRSLPAVPLAQQQYQQQPSV